MGNGTEFLENLGRASSAESQFVSLSAVRYVNGVSGRIVKRRGDPDTHTSLPQYAKTSDMYFRLNEKGVCQGRVYLDHKVVLDFDWSHNHTNKGKNHETFKAGTVHIQMWEHHPDGSMTRLSNDARGMTDQEIEKYGPIIKSFCPWVKLR